MNARTEVADFWDEVLDGWRPGEDHLDTDPLGKWFASYQGTGPGAVDLRHYPDPYIGDLRGIHHEPELVLLGLNPGIGYDSLQGDDGLWTKRIKNESYSKCLQRSPAEDPASWQALHGKKSAYWARLINFARRWSQRQDAGVHEILNFELYPWHSPRVTGPMIPPADILDRFIWAPAQEVATPAVFAFGAPWFKICDDLDLPVVAQYGQGGTPLPAPAPWHWRVCCYRLPSRQLAVVSAQQGYAGPPGGPGVEILRRIVADLT